MWHRYGDDRSGCEAGWIRIIIVNVASCRYQIAPSDGMDRAPAVQLLADGPGLPEERGRTGYPRARVRPVLCGLPRSGRE